MELTIGFIITIIMYVIFFAFQVLYITVPLLTVKSKRYKERKKNQSGISIPIPAYN